MDDVLSLNISLTFKDLFGEMIQMIIQLTSGHLQNTYFIVLIL